MTPPRRLLLSSGAGSDPIFSAACRSPSSRGFLEPCLRGRVLVGGILFPLNKNRTTLSMGCIRGGLEGWGHPAGSRGDGVEGRRGRCPSLRERCPTTVDVTSSIPSRHPDPAQGPHAFLLVLFPETSPLHGAPSRRASHCRGRQLGRTAFPPPSLPTPPAVPSS